MKKIITLLIFTMAFSAVASNKYDDLSRIKKEVRTFLNIGADQKDWIAYGKTSDGKRCCLYVKFSEKTISLQIITEDISDQDILYNTLAFSPQDGVTLKKLRRRSSSLYLKVFLYDSSLVNKMDHLKLLRTRKNKTIAKYRSDYRLFGIPGVLKVDCLF